MTLKLLMVKSHFFFSVCIYGLPQQQEHSVTTKGFLCKEVLTDSVTSENVGRLMNLFHKLEVTLSASPSFTVAATVKMYNVGLVHFLFKCSMSSLFTSEGCWYV